jgi:hypothetical protein
MFTAILLLPLPSIVSIPYKRQRLPYYHDRQLKEELLSDD